MCLFLVCFVLLDVCVCLIMCLFVRLFLCSKFVYTIEKRLELPDWNFCVYGESQLIVLFVGIFSIPKDEITNPFSETFGVGSL